MKQILCLCLVFLGLGGSFFAIQFSSVFLTLAFLLLLETTFSGTTNQIINLCEQFLAAEPENIKLKSELL